MYSHGVSSKIYNNMTAGKPVLFLGPKDIKIYNGVINNNIGFVFNFDEKNKTIDFFKCLYQIKKCSN